MKHEKLLHRLYYDTKSPVCFTGQQSLLKAAKKANKTVTLKDVITFLQSQDVYTMNKPLKRKFVKNKTTASGFMTDWQSDLMDMSKFSNENDTHKFVLCCIDVLSRYAWAIPMKNKTPQECIRAFEIVLKSGYKPFRLFTDMGGEYCNRAFEKMLEKHDIRHVTAKNTETKASIAERYIRSLKMRLYKAFYAQKSQRYLEILPNIVSSLNHSYHRTIERTPASVTVKNAASLRHFLYPRSISGNKHYKFSVGDKVRVSLLRKAFTKGYHNTFTKEIFVVSKRIPRKQPVYQLVDLANDPVIGTFYEKELVKVTKRDNVYRLERVIRKRTRKGVKEILIKWDGYPDKFNSWEKESNFIDV